MKFNFFDICEFEIDWRVVAAVAVCFTVYLIVTAIS